MGQSRPVRAASCGLASLPALGIVPAMRPLLLLCCLLGLLQSAELEHVKLQLNYFHQFQFAGYYAADRNGYFTDEGLAVEIAELAPDMEAEHEVLNGRAQFAIYSARIISDWAVGHDLALVAIIHQRNPDVLLVRDSSPWLTLNDILSDPKARLVGPVSSNTLELNLAIAALGRNPEKVFGRHKTTGDLERFVKGEIDVLPGYATNEPARLLELGVATRPLLYRADGHSPFFGDSLICRGELLRQRPDLVNRFRRACLRGWAWALSNQQQAVRIITEHWASAYQPSGPQQLLNEANALDSVIDRTVIELGTISVPRLEAIASQLRAAQLPGLVRRELIWQPSDPSRTWLSLSIWALSIAAAACLILLLAIVVTRRRLLGATLTQQRLMDLAESFLLFQAQAEGTSRLRFLQASPSVSVILGRSRSSYLSDPDALLRQVVGEDRPALLDAVTAAISQRRALRHRFRITHPEHDKARHLLLQAIPRYGSDPLEFDGMILDLTAEADAAEALLEVQRRLQTAQRNESLGLLAGGVAHDFNNLLGAIRGNAELAMSRLPDTHEARPRLQRVLQASDRAAGLVRQILAYAGKGTIEVRPINLVEECKVLRDLLKHAIPANVRLELDSPPILPEVQFDPAQLQQVLVNLIVNAAESYDGADGVVAIKLASLPGDPACIAVEISDRGCGMSQETQVRMFEPYFTTKKTGHGLGLAAVQGIITASGSQLLCTSRIGQGTTFTLRIPLMARRNPQVRVESPRPVAGKHVLVVDDDELMRDTASQMVRELGYVVDSVSGGEEALRRLSDPQRPYVAVILDCAMPDLDGTEVARRLRAAEDRLPLVLCSGMVEANRIGTGILDRRTRFLAKPFSKAMLDRTLRLLLRPDGEDDSSSSTFASMQRESSVFLSIRGNRNPGPGPHP